MVGLRAGPNACRPPAAGNECNEDDASHVLKLPMHEVLMASAHLAGVHHQELLQPVRLVHRLVHGLQLGDGPRCAQARLAARGDVRVWDSQTAMLLLAWSIVSFTCALRSFVGLGSHCGGILLTCHWSRGDRTKCRIIRYQKVEKAYLERCCVAACNPACIKTRHTKAAN